MGHGITDRDVMLYALEYGVPWHGLGVPLSASATSDEVLREAFGWEPVLRPVHYLGKPTGWQHVLRTEAGKPDVHLGIVGARMQPLSNRGFVHAMESVSGVADAHWAVAGSLHQGRQVWLVLDPTQLQLKLPRGDASHLWLVGVNNHDGRGRLRICVTATRAVCANTIASGWAGALARWQGRHTRHLRDRVAEIRETLGLANMVQHWESRFATLENLSLTGSQGSDVLKDWLQALYPINSDTTASAKSRMVRERTTLLDAMTYGKGNTGQTGYDAINGFVDVLEHRSPLMAVGAGRAVNLDRRMSSLLWGAKRKRVTDATTTLLALAQRTA